jgi:exopolysaccharide production protein ExoZ
LLFSGLLLMRVRPVAWLSILLTILAIVGLYRTDAGTSVTNNLLSPLLVEFVFGMLIGLVAIQGRFLPVRFALPVALASLGALILSNALGMAAEPYRLLVWGMPGALLLAAVVALEDWLRKRPIKLFVQIGKGSYSLYLLHPLVLGAVWVAASKAKVNHGFFSYAIYVAAPLLCIAVAWIVHRSVEVPMTPVLTLSAKAARSNATHNTRPLP